MQVTTGVLDEVMNMGLVLTAEMSSLGVVEKTQGELRVQCGGSSG